MLKMIVYIISQKPGKYKTNFIKPSQRKTDILYREFACAVRGTVSCEGEQPEEEVPDTRYLFKNKKKKIS